MTLMSNFKTEKSLNKEMEETINKLRQCIDDEGVSCERKIDEIKQTRICNRKGVHTCRTGAIHIPDNYNGTLEALLTKE